jgi:predicted  nucleic acid-binding Zn-ribbon protein
MDIEENKMKISDTPRTDDAEYLSYDSEPPESLEMVDVEFARKLEIELNTAVANEAFAENKVYMLEKQLKEANERIKRLDETLEAVTDKLDGAWGIYMEFKEPKP